ncbi:unnamed protein product [Phytomonas sp. Hart1]|nr:unnamed protein product [Phytomonas sp. Hart1]|eukprot:CCW66512.1 unnamed protein product [Phytomonas sp. isolate Hart1]
MYSRGQGLPILWFVLLCLAFCLFVQPTHGGGDAFLPRTRRQRTLHVGRLEPSMDDINKDVVLVSIAEELSLFLPFKQGSVDTIALENLAFDGSFDPLWFYVFMNHKFEDLEWASCSGQWRPEWSSPLPYEVDDEDRFFTKENITTTEEGSNSPPVPHEHTFEYVRYILSHHDACSLSSFSFCAHSDTESPTHQFQWVAEFMSTLLSSPLSWTDQSSRHSRPCGTIFQPLSDSPKSSTNMRNSANPSASWCSYHQIFHDVICSHHLNSLLNGGRHFDGEKGSLPEGIFSAVFPSFNDFFSAPFAHVHFRAKQELQPGSAGEPTELELRIQTRMSFVLTNEVLINQTAMHWLKTLQPYSQGGDLSIYVGRGGLPKPLDKALPIEHGQLRRILFPYKLAVKPTVALPETLNMLPEERESALEMLKHLSRPDVKYSFRPVGKDHGYLVVTLQPSLLLSVCELSRRFSGVFPDKLGPAHMPFKEGDVVYSLLFFPLHLVRPRFYNMESLAGSTEVENYMTDVSTNTFTILLKTKITSLHVEVYRLILERAVQRTQDCQDWEMESLELSGLLLARFQFYNGWTGLQEMPQNANGYRIIPQPIVFIEREVKWAETTDKAVSCSVICQRENLFSELTHIDIFLKLLQALRKPSQGSNYMETDSFGASSVSSVPRDASTCRCQYGVRAAPASGVFIPEPDASMEFNFVVLGLMFASIAAVLLTKEALKLASLDLNSESQVHGLLKDEINGRSNESDELLKKNQ